MYITNICTYMPEGKHLMPYVEGATLRAHSRGRLSASAPCLAGSRCQSAPCGNRQDRDMKMRMSMA